MLCFKTTVREEFVENVLGSEVTINIPSRLEASSLLGLLSIFSDTLGHFMMAGSHIMLQNLYVFIAFSTCLIFFAKVSSTLTKTPRSKIVLPLIHHDSVLSPFYNPTLNVINSEAESSLPPDDIRSNLVPGNEGFAFLVNVSIGEPPVPQLLVMDTGSSLTWVCTKCVGSILRRPLYDPAQSSTYKELPCDLNSECSKYNSISWCGQGSECSYNISYADGSNSRGDLANEKFTFETSSDGLMEVPDIIFGSAAYVSGVAARIQGIFGLGPSYGINLLEHFSNQFSYCIGNISDKSYMFNQLIIGDGAILEGSSTDMLTNGEFYYVNLEGISVGEKQLSIDFSGWDHHLMIDSGCTFTRLRRRLFDPLKKEVMNLLDGLLQPFKSFNTRERLCYLGNLERDLKGFPTVTFHFSGETDLELNVEAMFRRENDDAFCMAVVVDERGYHSTLGVYAQQYYNIGFDMEYNKISFQRIDCELLE